MRTVNSQDSTILRKGVKDNSTIPSEDNFFVKLQMQQSNLCDDLISPYFNAERWIKNAKSFLKTYHRFLYADISNFVYNISLDPNKEGIFLTNLSAVTLSVKSNYEITPANQRDEIFRILKFCDHSNLAYQQSQLVSSAKQELRKDISSDIDDAVTNTTKDISSQLVGLVSLFTALAFILFGGIASLDSIFTFLGNMLNSESRWFAILPPVIVALLWVFGIANILFLFMVFVLRIIDRPLHYGGATYQPGAQHALETLKQFPILIFIDYILFSLISSLLLLYIISVTATGSQLISSIMSFAGQWIIILGIIAWIFVLDLLRLWVFGNIVIFGDGKPKLFVATIFHSLKQHFRKGESNNITSTDKKEHF